MSHSDYQPCCPPFNASFWDEKTNVWQDKPFITDNVVQVLHIPLNIGRVIRRMWKRVTDAGAALPAEECLILAYDPSPWKSELLVAVAREVPGAKNVMLTGEFVSKVFEGPYCSVPKWLRTMEGYLAGVNKRARRYYVHFASCPKCARHYGKNYAVVFAQLVSENEADS